MKRTKRDPLVGKFFHRFQGDVIDWQGKVLARMKAGLYLVQLFSWLGGEETDQVFVTLAQMRNWKFYRDAELMKWRHERWRDRQAAQERRGMPRDRAENP